MGGKIEIRTLEVGGFVPAIIGMRNPMDSWTKSDSSYNESRRVSEFIDIEPNLNIGRGDMDLAKRLIKGGSEHCKFLRQITVWADMTLPRYIWSELDTYGHTVKNSCSTMHTLLKNDIDSSLFYTGDDLEVEMLIKDIIDFGLLPVQNEWRTTKNPELKSKIKKMLPESFLQMRTVSFNYQTLMNIHKQRKNHTLKAEWGYICEWIDSLPYMNDFLDSLEA